MKAVILLLIMLSAHTLNHEPKLLTNAETITMPNQNKQVTDDEWRKLLTAEQYRVLRQKGTEAPFTGEYVDTETEGSYACAACGTILFESTTKFHSGCGWPSFWDAADQSKIEYREDHTFGMNRTEVMCKNCGGHLGHLFNDGPAPTGERYCINSVSLKFIPK